MLPVAITRGASTQAYYMIRFLIDRDRALDAYRAYAYFRWLDDHIDQRPSERAERLALVRRQQALVEHCYHGNEPPEGLAAEEQMVVDLIRSDPDAASGLAAYIRNLFAVMAFDADRRGRVVTRSELSTYSRSLAVAVTEGLHYFTGRGDATPDHPARYFAVTAAHISHMLRDTYEDVAAGYFNIAAEFLDANGITAADVHTDAYREWVRSQVEEARAIFAASKRYLPNVRNVRCRLANYAYIARFEWVLDAVERDDYRLRPAYSERKSVRAGLRMAWSTLTSLARRQRT
jgi:hypothetical protein